MMLRRRMALGGAAALLALPVRAAEVVQVHAAMTFKPALDAVLAAWRAAGGTAIGVYAPTPVLVRQLAEGAPADLLLTADPMWMDDAARRGLIDPTSRVDLLGNDLVLAGPEGAAAVAEITRDFPLMARLAGGRLAMCDPDHDPAGRYAKQSLTALGFWADVAPRVAIAESAPAAVTMVDHGEAPAAACFATDLHGDPHVARIGRFPADSHAPIVYPVALTKRAQGQAAKDTLAFLNSEKASAIFTGYGYRALG